MERKGKKNGDMITYQLSAKSNLYVFFFCFKKSQADPFNLNYPESLLDINFMVPLYRQTIIHFLEKKKVEEDALGNQANGNKIVTS